LCGVDSAYLLVSSDSAEIGVSALAPQPFGTKFDHVSLLPEHQLLNCWPISGAVRTEPFRAGWVAVTCQLAGLRTAIVCTQDGSPQQLFPT
jgi:hypothetical protein